MIVGHHYSFNIVCVRLLLHRHANIESKNKYIYNGSWSALVVVCQRGHVDCVHELLERSSSRYLYLVIILLGGSAYTAADDNYYVKNSVLMKNRNKN